MALDLDQIIIFHPGYNLRFEKATADRPQSIMQAIARNIAKTKPTNSQLQKFKKRPVLPFVEKQPPEMESARLQLSVTLRQIAAKSELDMSEKKRAQFNRQSKFELHMTEEEIAQYNRESKSKGVLIERACSWRKNFKFSCVESICGNSVLEINPSDFNIYFPWRRGTFNTNSGVGGSITSVLTDMEEIWKWCLTEKLKVNLCDIKEYKAVVIIPALFTRNEASHIMDLVLKKIGFGAATLIQEHCAASFLYPTSTTCVCDVGHDKISVSCVHNGLSIPKSRMELKYGGLDLTLALWDLMKKQNVPLPVDTSCLWDIDYLNKLKEAYCHVDFHNSCAVKDSFVWDKWNGDTLRFDVALGDELRIVPLSYFNPDLLRGSVTSDNEKTVVDYDMKTKDISAHDDPFDNDFLNDANYRTEELERRLGAQKLARRRRAQSNDEEMDTTDMIIHTYNSIPVGDSSRSIKAPLNIKPIQPELWGIHEAIIKSIASCDDIGLQTLLCSNIMVIGNGFAFEGLNNWLEDRLNTFSTFREPKSRGETKSRYKEPPKMRVFSEHHCEPGDVAWKGAQVVILNTSDSANEFMVTADEWKHSGSQILRERCLATFETHLQPNRFKPK